MARNTKKTVSFSVSCEEEKQALNELAKDRKLQSISILAAHALEQYLTRYKYKERVQERTKELKEEYVNGIDKTDERQLRCTATIESKVG